MAQQIIDSRSFNVRRKATGNMNFYVSPSGSDSNDGLTASTPMLTIAAMLNRMVSEWDFCGKTATINFAEGTYNQAILIISRVFVGLQSLTIKGAGATDTILDAGGEQGLRVLYCNVPLYCQDFQITNSAPAFVADKAVYISLNNIAIGKPSVASWMTHLSSSHVEIGNLTLLNAWSDRLFLGSGYLLLRLIGPIDLGSQTSTFLYSYGHNFIQCTSSFTFTGNTTGYGYQMRQGGQFVKGNLTIPGIAGTADASSYVW
jgi:hypothetical protein